MFKSESDLLRGHGHEVEQLIFENKEIKTWWDKIKVGLKTIYNPTSTRIISKKIEGFNPDVVHVHNFFPLASPAVFFSAQKFHVPVVLTLHNYRLICPSATLFFEGRIYEKNVGKVFAWHAVMRGVYHESRIQTLAIALMLGIHNLIGTWRNRVSAYIALSQFAKEKFIDSSLAIPEQKIHVKSNFIHDPGRGEATRQDFFLFVGRLTEEKGINTLVEAAASQKFQLVVLGDGPLSGKVKQAAEANSHLHYLGQQDHENVLFFLKNCRALIFPSVWYEGFPIILLEAFATGTAVISSKLGSMCEIIQDNVNGMYVEAGNANALIARICELNMNPSRARRLGENARTTYRMNYTPAINYSQLIDIYLQVAPKVRVPSKVGQLAETVTMTA